jgi:hypothetical protein
MGVAENFQTRKHYTKIFLAVCFGIYLPFFTKQNKIIRNWHKVKARLSSAFLKIGLTNGRIANSARTWKIMQFGCTLHSLQVAERPIKTVKTLRFGSFYRNKNQKRLRPGFWKHFICQLVNSPINTKSCNVIGHFLAFL